LLQEKTNKNGNITLKEYKAFTKTLNDANVDNLFDLLIDEASLENRKTIIHIYSEIEKLELAKRK
jgi:hypothetical protein